MQFEITQGEIRRDSNQPGKKREKESTDDEKNGGCSREDSKDKIRGKQH